MVEDDVTFAPRSRGHTGRANAPLALIVAAVTLLLAGCALEPFEEKGVKSVTSITGVTTPVGEPSEFVREARPAAPLAYLPVGVTPPKRAEKTRTPEEVAKLEAELNAQKAASSSFVTRPAPKATYDGKPAPKVAPPPKELTPE